MCGGLVDISCLLVEQFEALAEADVEFDGLAVEALGGLLRLLARPLLLGGDRGVEEEPVALAFEALGDQVAGLRRARRARRGWTSARYSGSWLAMIQLVALSSASASQGKLAGGVDGRARRVRRRSRGTAPARRG